MNRAIRNIYQTREEKALYDKNRYPLVRERKLAQSKKYRLENPEKVREWNRIKIARLRKEVFDLLDGKCFACGFSDKRALQIDHVNGGGNKERKNHKSTYGYLKFVLKNKGKYQILCANCNWIKREEKGELIRV